MKKFVFISSVATPSQIKLSTELAKYFDAEFWFYESPERTRGSWWRINMSDNSLIIPRVFSVFGRYISFSLIPMLMKRKPDILMLGGFSIPGNMLAYLWAVLNRKKIIVFTERSRDKYGSPRKFDVVWRTIKAVYRKIDLIIVSAPDIEDQFRNEFHFGDKVVVGQYPADLEAFVSHKARKKSRDFTYLFANRLTQIYEPLLAIKIFNAIWLIQPNSRLLLNARGELRRECELLITKLGLQSVASFLDDLKSWDELHLVYARSDILLLPANFSNGNFTVLEAMASGMGIVISDRVLGIGLLVEDGKNGFRCEHEFEQYIDRLKCYLGDPPLIELHAKKNREIIKDYTVEATASNLYSICKENLLCP